MAIGAAGAAAAAVNPVGLAGSAIGGLAAGGSSVLQWLQGKDAADASQKAADAALAASKQTQQMAMGAAAPTALELGNMSAQLAQAGQALQRQQKLFDAVDPAMMEAGKQALQLMQGQNASTVAPMLAQRAQQRMQLQQQLQQQLGPGGASSSAGAQALANFDLQTSNFQAGLQQQMLGTMLGQTNDTAASGMASGNQGASIFGQVQGQAANIQGRQMNAITGTAENIITNSGAPFVGQYQNAQNTGQLFGQLGAVAGQMAGFKGGSATTGGMFGKTPTAQPTLGTQTASAGAYGMGMPQAQT